MKVIIYTTPTCYYCQVAKEFFRQNNISFEEIDVANNQEKAQEMVEKSGQFGVPVFDINGHIVVGFDKPQILKLLKSNNF
jgi:glutaredoxin 3